MRYSAGPKNRRAKNSESDEDGWNRYKDDKSSKTDDSDYDHYDDDEYSRYEAEDPN